MKRVAFWLLFFGVALGVRAQSPDAEFLRIYNVMQEGETLERSGQPADAIDRFKVAQQELQQFSKAYPSWNEKLIKFRLSYLTGKIGSLSWKKAPVPSRSTPAGTLPLASVALSRDPASLSSEQERLVRAEARATEAEARAEQALRNADEATVRANRADERTAQLALDLRMARDRVDVLRAEQQNLEAARTRLETERVTLQARLKEALAPKPAGSDPAEFARAQERNLLLTKENEILKASLGHQMAEYKRVVETAAKALELERQLGIARTELVAVRHENHALREDREKLAARVEALGRKADPTAVLRGEIETLKRELAEARGGTEGADAATELAQLRSELMEQRTAASELRSDNATLVRELEKLTAIKVTPASLRTAEVASVEMAASEAAGRVRRLQRERDDLRRALDEARGELHRRDLAGEAKGAEWTRKVAGLEARIASLEAKPEPYLPEELALFQPPSRPVELAQPGPAVVSAPVVAPAPAPAAVRIPATTPSSFASITPIDVRRATASRPILVAQASPTPPAAPAAADTAVPTPAASGNGQPSGDATGTPPGSTNAPGSTAATAPSPGGGDTNSVPASGGGRRRTLRDLPPGASILAAQAQRAFVQRRFEDAEKAYREILTLDERNVFTLGNLAAILVERGRLEEGEAILKRALEGDPMDPFSLSLQGIIRFRQQRYDEAFDSLSRSAQMDPENADTQNYLGITLSQRGQRKAAEAALRKALKLSPTSPAAHYNLAVVYATQKPPFMGLAKYHYEKARRAGQPPNPAFEGVLRGETPEAPAP